MATSSAAAPAKVNLTLHVTGQRDDGYHLLDSLVVFAGVADQLAATVAPDLRINISGPFSTGVPTNHTNLVLRAAENLRSTRGVTKGAAITLEKHLPHAAGIGSGSSDAAAALALLAKIWGVAPLPATAAEVISLGADVPVCMRSPAPTRMSGIGDILSPVPQLPDCAMVLVRPPVEVPTNVVFKGLASKTGTPMARMPDGMDFEAFARWLSAQRNDMAAPACLLAPDIAEAIAQLKANPNVAAAGMSGSGATCYGLVKDMATARQVARVIQLSHMGWWVAPAELLGRG